MSDPNQLEDLYEQQVTTGTLADVAVSTPAEIALKKVEQLQTCIEEVAREEAEHVGFDMQTEPNALFRMTMKVLANNSLREEAMCRYKGRYEQQEEGTQ